MCRYAQSCAFISVIELPRIPAYCPKKGYTLKGLYCVEYGTGIKKKIKNGNVITLNGMHYMLIEYKNVSKNYSYATFLFGK